jgi:dTDP-4-dehydrorhamnose reductase
MKKIIVMGGTGLLGQALQKEITHRGYNCYTVARFDAQYCIDITKDIEITNLLNDIKPDVVINAVAIVNHKICDENPDLAYKTNARPSSILANLSSELGYKYVYISTDGYFNGDKNKKHSEDTPVLLLNEYARTKYIGEIFSLTNRNSLVARTNIVGFRNKKNAPTFVEWVINSLKNKEEMTLFDDYYTSSISVAQFSKALLDLIDKDTKGIVNLAGSEVSSKKEFIEKLAEVFNFSLENTKTGKVASLTTSKRADSLGLDVSKAEKILEYKLPTLDEVISQLKKEYDNV